MALLINDNCTACDACLETERFCVFEDDMQPLYRQFIEADLVVLASPVYWWSISAQLKVFIDRLYGLNFGKHPELANCHLPVDRFGSASQPAKPDGR